MLICSICCRVLLVTISWAHLYPCTFWRDWCSWGILSVGIISICTGHFRCSTCSKNYVVRTSMFLIISFRISMSNIMECVKSLYTKTRFAKTHGALVSEHRTASNWLSFCFSIGGFATLARASTYWSFWNRKFAGPVWRDSS